MAYPHMPLYTTDFIADTTHLDACETGAYMMLLMIMWQSPGCRLPDNDERLRRWARCSPRRWPAIREVVFEFFEQDADGYWFSPRLQAEHARLTRMMEARRQAGRAGGLARAQNQARNEAAAASEFVATTAEELQTDPVIDSSRSGDGQHLSTNVVQLPSTNAHTNPLKNIDPGQASAQANPKQSSSKSQPSRSRSRSRNNYSRPACSGGNLPRAQARTREAPPNALPAGRLEGGGDLGDLSLCGGVSANPPASPPDSPPDPGLERALAAMGAALSPVLPPQARRDGRWLAALRADGFDLEADILPAIAERAAQLPPGSVRSPGGYFGPVIRDARARRAPLAQAPKLAAFLAANAPEGWQAGELAGELGGAA